MSSHTLILLLGMRTWRGRTARGGRPSHGQLVLVTRVTRKVLSSCTLVEILCCVSSLCYVHLCWCLCCRVHLQLCAYCSSIGLMSRAVLGPCARHKLLVFRSQSCCIADTVVFMAGDAFSNAWSRFLPTGTGLPTLPWEASPGL